MFARGLLAVVSAVALGTLCGWLTGRGDSDPTIIAAAIPAILSVAGTFLFARSLAGGDVVIAGHGALFIVAFCATFALGVVRTVEMRNAAADRSILETLERRIDLAFECSDAQEFLNTYRASLKLEPLSFQEVCTLSK